jgi:MoxR-like ATPase
MEESQVTIDGKTHPMQLPFMVVATQNPVEQEGTYRLPEAQLDRFLFKINVPYPSLDEEVKIIGGHNQLKQGSQLDAIARVLSGSQLKSLQEQIRAIHIEEKLIHFIARVVTETRNNRSIFLGASPRASVGIMQASKSVAAMRGRDFVTPDDIIYVINPVLRHRIMIAPEKEMEGVTPEDVINEIVKGIEIPR